MFTYVAPLVFVLVITIGKEAWDDYQRYLRDRELNGDIYEKLMANGNSKSVRSAKLRVGDIIRVN